MATSSLGSAPASSLRPVTGRQSRPAALPPLADTERRVHATERERDEDNQQREAERRQRARSGEPQAADDELARAAIRGGTSIRVMLRSQLGVDALRVLTALQQHTAN